MEHRLRGGGAQGYQAACLVTLSPTTGAWSLTLHASTLKGPRNCLSWPIIFPPSLHFISRADPQIAHDPVRRTRSYDRGKRIAPFWTCFPQHTYTKKKNVGEDRVDEIQRNLVSIQTGASLKAHRRTQWCCPLYIYIFFSFKRLSRNLFNQFHHHHHPSPPPPLTAVTSTRDHLVRKRVYG